MLGLMDQLRYASTFTVLLVVLLLALPVVVIVKWPSKLFNYEDRILPLGIEDRWAVERWQEIVVLAIRLVLFGALIYIGVKGLLLFGTY